MNTSNDPVCRRIDPEKAVELGVRHRIGPRDGYPDRPGPDRHVGGGAYLCLRGMTGADGPLVDGEPCGVFAWRPPSSFVLDLSDALDRGDP